MSRPERQNARRASRQEEWPEDEYYDDYHLHRRIERTNHDLLQRSRGFPEEDDYEMYRPTNDRTRHYVRREGPNQNLTRKHPPASPYKNAEFYYEDEEEYFAPPRYKQPSGRERRNYREEEYGRSHRPERIPHSHRYTNERPYPQEREQRPRTSMVQQRSRVHEYQQEQTQREKSAYKKIGSFLYNLLFYSLTIGILLMSVMFAFSDKGDASIFGYRFYNVLTNSMAPVEGSHSGGFYSGDMVLVKMTKGSEVQKDDIVTYRVGDGSRYLTHRMVDRLEELNGEEGDYIITKGDANQANDPPVQADRVLGKVVFAIPKLGTIIEFVRENIWLSGLLLLTLFAFLVVFKAYLFSEETRKQPNDMRYSHDFKRNRVI